MSLRNLFVLVGLCTMIGSFTGCGADTGSKVLEGEVKVDPDVGDVVNDPAAMEKMMNADPTESKQ